VNVELPAVIRAFHVAALELAAFESSEGKGHAAVRTSIVESEWPTFTIAANNERLFEQRGGLQRVSSNVTAVEGAVPETEQHKRIRRLLLKGLAGHARRKDIKRLSWRLSVWLAGSVLI
jgi:hypothetical protein